MEELQFTWDMDEDDWWLMMREHNEAKKKPRSISVLPDDPETYGYCFVGYLRIDIMHTLDPFDCQGYTDIYALGVDNGYEDFYHGQPFSLIEEGPRLWMACKSFKKFKISTEKRLREYISKSKERTKLARMPLGWR